MKRFFILVSMIIMSVQGVDAQYESSWTSLDKRETPQWWKNAKFGIFIHWGLYSVPAYAPVNEVEGIYEKYAEHYMSRLITGNKLFVDHHQKYYGKNFTYQDFASMFKAEYFNPNDWADLFVKSGAKYVVLTSKHHDGFCLWPSNESPQWNSVAMGPHLDIIDTLSKAVRSKGLKMGLYYSLLEWNHPLYKKETIREWTETHMIPQLKELVTNYKPEVIFADGEWDYDSKTLQSEKFLSWLYNSSPVKNSVVVNDRWGKETRSKHGDYYTTEYDLVHDEKGIGKAATHPWEESRGIGTSYGYNQFETNDHYFTSKQLIDLLIEKVINGGNLLLNIGPKANGLIPVIMQERLLDMGKWLKVNGEAIYGTDAWRSNAKPDSKDLHFTKKGKDLYVICTQWPKQAIKISGIKSINNVTMLGSGKNIPFKTEKNRLEITVPPMTIDELPCQYAWVLKLTEVRE